MLPQYLADKYNVAAPRYTSYPTMPYWETATFSRAAWESSVKTSFLQSNIPHGISLYIHLPYCENLCTYCGCNTRITKNHSVEEPYIASVLKEWITLLASSVSVIAIKKGKRLKMVFIA